MRVAYKLRSAALSLIALGSLSAGAVQWTWPQFHGPFRDNISRETPLADAWPEEGPPLIWKASGLGHGFSSVAVGRGIICTAGNVGDQTIVTALDEQGRVKWRAPNGPAWKRDFPGTRSTPTIDGDRVYHQSPLGSLACFETKSGRELWRINVLRKFHSKPNKWGLAESVLVDGNRVISTPGGPETCVVAFDKYTGKLLWKSPTTNELAGYASPILAEYKGLRIIITLTAKALVGINAETGDLLWHVPHKSYADENIMMPIFHEGCVFISTLVAGSVKWKLEARGGKVQIKELWRTKELDNHHGGVVLLKGYLYGTSTVRNAKKWVCLDWRTGKVLYAVRGVGKGSLTCADGKLYTLSIDRKVGLVHPSPQNFRLVSTFEIPKGGKGRSWAHPVVCNGRLYIRHGEFLYVYNVK